jgi:tetratricopeptide (TPR) repeat protein
LLGTLAYMSPEQAAGDPDRIDTRTDVYSLGVILYQMLTGRFPYPTHGALTEVLENIRHAEPKAPRSVDRRVGDELETIVLKCLQKEKDRRYQSANELGRDIQRYLKGDAIEAKRDSAWYVLRKSVKRHRGPVTAAVAFVLLLIGALMVSVTLLGKTRSAESRATDQYESAKRISDFYSGLLLKMDRWHPKALTFGVAPGEVRLSDLVREAARLVPDAFGDRPDLAADLQYKIGRALVGLGLEEEAERVFRDSYEQARAALGDDHPAALALWRNIGLSLLARDAWADAVHVLEEVAKQSVRALGEDHHQSLYGLMALNWSMRLSERVEDSEQLSRRSLAALRRALGEDDPLHVEALTQHAVVLLFHGKLEEAEAVARQAVDQAGAIGGGRSEYRAFALASLQHVRAMQERWPDAAELAREEVQLRRAVDGPNHFQTDCAVLTLVIALSRTGECEESLALGREVVAREARQAGVPDAVRVYGASNLVYALLNCGDAREAERLARETLDSLGAVASPSPGSHMSVRLALADALDAQGRTAEAQATAVEALRDGLAAGAPITSHDWGGLFYPGWYPLRNRCLIRMGLYAEAEWRLLADHQRLTSASAPDHARTRSIISDLVALYETWNAAGPASGCAEKAAQWRARLLALPPVAALGTKSADPRNGDNGE